MMDDTAEVMALWFAAFVILVSLLMIAVPANRTIDSFSFDLGTGEYLVCERFETNRMLCEIEHEEPEEGVIYSVEAVR